MAFTGAVAALPLGEGGLTGNTNHTQIGPQYLIEALNVTYQDGSVGKEGGSQRLTPAPIGSGSSILAGSSWSPDGVTSRSVVYQADGHLRMDYGDGSYGTSLGTGFTTTPRTVPVFVECGAEAPGENRHLVVFNGYDSPRQLDGAATTLAELTARPTEWTTAGPTTGCLHNNRLWALRDHRVFYSLATDHTDFNGAGAGSINVYPGEGQYGVQLLSFKGLLILWKFPVGIFAINTTAIDSADWTVSRISATIGTHSSRSAVMIEDDVLFLDQGGNVQLLSGIQEYGNLGSRNLSQLHKMAEFLRTAANLNRLHRTQAVYYAAKREVHIALAASGATTNTARLVVDFNAAANPRFRWSDKDVCEGLWLQNDVNNVQRLTSGDAAGRVWQLDQANRIKTDASYTGVFQTAHTDLAFLDASLASKRKEGRFFELTVTPKGTWPIYVDVYWDGVFTHTMTFEYGAGGFVLDEDMLDVDYLGGVVPGGGVPLGSFTLGVHRLSQWLLATIKKRLAGGGKRVSFRIYTLTQGSDFSINRALLYFKAGNERTLR